MSEPRMVGGDLEAELRSYFALTTSTALPMRVREMGVRTLGRRQARRPSWLPAGAGLLATAALVLVLVIRLGSHGGTTASLSTGAGGGAEGTPVQAPKSLATIPYPGVDTGALAAAGVRLLPPSAGAQARITAAQARAAAVASVGARAGSPGPAVLALVQLAHLQPRSCLCWAVDVPVEGGLSAAQGNAPRLTELVLVDAFTGRVDAALTGNGIP